MEETLPGFRVRRIETRDPSEPWIYLSMGASTVQGWPHEFALLPPIADERHVETLAMVADWVAAGRDGSVGTVLAIGKPWVPGSAADHLLMTPLYAFPEEVELVRDGPNEISILWLVPIHANEAAYVRRRGMERLEERFEQYGVNLVDPRRPSVLGTSAI
ncbi:suppressor of fused domain protein [Streptomyces melanogenes]|uniref:suppressor of fused domain protein n=1 Tax=Streptomyces melanogenes TaxID=67326 RepID=UPI00167D0004|nr:suppressor of fused domain protein [Streptomyces melanogenes]